MRKILPILFVLIAGFSYGQQHLFGGVQLELGTFLPKYQENRSVLYSPQIPLFYQPKFSLQYRIANAFSVEGGVGFKRFALQLRDKTFEARHPGFEVQAKSVASFVSLFGTMQYAHRLDAQLFAYGQVGFSYDLIGSETLVQEKESVISQSFTQTTEKATITSNFKARSQNITPEFGVQYFDHKQNMYSIGLAYNVVIDGPMQTTSYSIANQDSTISTDQATISGSYLAVNMRYNHLLYYSPKKEKLPKEKKKKEEEIDKIIPPVDSVQAQPDTIIQDKGKVNDREIITTHKIKVGSPNLTIKVYDHQIVDGDIISLILGNDWILEEHTLTKEKLELKVTVPEGNTNLILYALNLGKYSPNTAAIIVDDGIKEQQVVLESNLNESGTLEIKFKP